MSLLTSIQKNKTKLALKLLQNTYNPNTFDKKTQKTLLHYTVENRNHEILSKLLSPEDPENMPDLFMLDNDGNYPITIAIENGDEKSVYMLLKKKSYIFSEDYPLEFSAAELRSENCLRMILENGGDFNICNEDGGILHIAIREDSVKVLNYVLEELKEFDFCIKDADDCNILLLCVAMNNFVMLGKILDHFLVIFEMNDLEKNKKIYELLNERDINDNYLWHLLAIYENPLLDFLIAKKDLFKIDLETKNKKNQSYKDILVKNVEMRDLKKLKKKKKLEDNKIKRIQKKEQQNFEEEKKKKNEEILKQKILEQEKEKLVKIKEEQTMRKFYCIAFCFVFIIVLYFYIKVRIENKKKSQGYFIN